MSYTEKEPGREGLPGAMLEYTGNAQAKRLALDMPIDIGRRRLDWCKVIGFDELKRLIIRVQLSNLCTKKKEAGSCVSFLHSNGRYDRTTRGSWVRRILVHIHDTKHLVDMANTLRGMETFGLGFAQIVDRKTIDIPGRCHDAIELTYRIPASTTGVYVEPRKLYG